ncbi:glutaredoxin family protein [Neobacillus sp. PS3-34]|uniref:glutaredoxin family protein n=1 Tax=Neobacillus sp. PS3-34 TaxID=3070678 RepID=UPI0027E1167F|nr:glutaredoxin family protein [Neobacillus sp. PS3-34]WML46975.1 glutaredoxin family protein [Neobacillus sp. PS3-34]
MKQTVLTFYTRRRCPLCEKAKSELMELQNEHPFLFEEIDIEESDELTEQYGLMIPVFVLDGEEVGFGHVNKFDISKRLQEKTLSL